MTLLGWWVITCSGVSLCAVSVIGMITFWNDTFEAAPWQIYLIYLATVILTGKSSTGLTHQQKLADSNDSLSTVSISQVSS